jgi:hypothetical protein
MDHILLLLFTAQVTIIVADRCFSKCLNTRPVISISTFFYCCLASHIFLLLGFYSPVYIAACLLNILGNTLAIVTGATLQRDFPDIFYGTGFAYEYDAEAYCWYLLHWIWSDSMKVFACCVLSALVPAIIFLALRVCSWVFPPRRQRTRWMDGHLERIKADTLAIYNSLKIEDGWTDEDVEGLMRLDGGNDEAARARIKSFVDGVMDRREQSRQGRPSRG